MLQEPQQRQRKPAADILQTNPQMVGGIEKCIEKRKQLRSFVKVVPLMRVYVTNVQRKLTRVKPTRLLNVSVRKQKLNDR